MMSQESAQDYPLNIIVVDDSEFSRKTIVSILEEAGHKIAGEASNAEETFEILNTSNPDLVILDVVMPEVTGIDLANHIHDNFEDLYIIMVSSLGQEHIIIESIGAGAVDFIQKPFRKEDLLISVGKVAARVQKDREL